MDTLSLSYRLYSVRQSLQIQLKPSRAVQLQKFLWRAEGKGSQKSPGNHQRTTNHLIIKLTIIKCNELDH